MSELQERRKAVGLTQAQLAQAASCSVSLVALYETGYEPNKSEAAQRIEKALQRAEKEKA